MVPLAPKPTQIWPSVGFAINGFGNRVLFFFVVTGLKQQVQQVLRRRTFKNDCQALNHDVIF